MTPRYPTINTSSSDSNAEEITADCCEITGAASQGIDPIGSLHVQIRSPAEMRHWPGLTLTAKTRRTPRNPPSGILSKPQRIFALVGLGNIRHLSLGVGRFDFPELEPGRVLQAQLVPPQVKHFRVELLDTLSCDPRRRWDKLTQPIINATALGLFNAG